LSREFKSLAQDDTNSKRFKGEEANQILDKFIMMTRDDQSITRSTSTTSSSAASTTTQTLNYLQLRSEYHLDPLDKSNDPKIDVYISMNWVKRTKLSKKECKQKNAGC